MFYMFIIHKCMILQFLSIYDNHFCKFEFQTLDMGN